GGYADPLATAWSANTQSLIAVRLAAPAMTDASQACASCDLAVRQSLAVGDRGFASALVVGSQLFVSVDSTDINLSSFGTGTNTGHVIAADLTGVTSPVTIASFAGA